jgi:hypothetical protein
MSLIAASLSGCGPEFDESGSLSSPETPRQARAGLATAGNTLYGYWSASGGMDPASTGNRTFFLEVDAMGSLNLSLTSTANTYLYILDLTGQVIFQGGGSTSSQVYVFLEGGIYKVVAATSTPGQRAEFTLSTDVGRLRYPQRLYVRAANSYTWIYDDRGSGADRDVSVWRPNLAYYKGHLSLGNVAVSYYGAPTVQTLVAQGEGDVLATPIDYTQEWNDRGSSGDSDGSFWKPIPRAGYTCLGTVTVRGYTKPSTDLIHCVKSEYVLPANATFIWSDRGSGADMDVSLYRMVPKDERGMGLNTFFAQPNYSGPNLSAAWVLNRSAVTSW